MIALYLLIPIVLLIAISIIETIFAKRVIQKHLGNAPFVHIEDLYGFGSSVGMKVNLPSTPGGKLEAFLLDDLIIITGKVSIFWLFKKQKKPLVLLRPNMKRGEQHFGIQQIDHYKVFDTRIRIGFNYGGVSKVQYTLGINRSASKEDGEALKKWFEEKIRIEGD